MRHISGRLTAVIVSLLGFAAGPVWALALTVTAELEQPVAVLNYPCYLRVTVKNPNASDVTVTSTSVNLGPGLAGNVTAPWDQGFGGGVQTLIVPAGGQAVTTAIFVPTATGAGNLTVTVGSGTSAAVHVTVNPIAAAAGAMEIRHNIVLTTRSNGGVTFNQPALIVLHGSPGGLVHIEIRAPSGEDRGSVQSFTSSSGATQVVPVPLDAAGNGSFMWDGQAGTTLDTGVWWVIASGAVNARKPVLILDHKQ